MLRPALRMVDQAIATGCRWIVIGTFGGLFILLSLGIAQRLVPGIQLSGYDELIELLFAWMTFSGAVALWREGALYRVDLLDHVATGHAGRALAVTVQAAMLGVALLLALKGTEFLLQSNETTPFLQLDKNYWYATIPLAGALMTAYSIRGLWGALRGRSGTAANSAR
jgi:TRAP-type C4-dicarboxylate transport system permease small subunit